jgi:hypothetical protein
MTWYRYTDCKSFGQYVSSKTKYIDDMKVLFPEANYTEANPASDNIGRLRAGVSSGVPELASEHRTYYNPKSQDPS